MSTDLPVSMDGFSSKLSGISAANAQEITRLDELSYELKIQDVMSRRLITLHPEQTMSTVVDIFRSKRISGAPVVVSDELVGIISIEDVIHCLLNGDLATPVGTYMTTSIITVNAHDPLIKAVERFSHTGVGRLPVLDEHQHLVGMITKGDINRGLLQALQTQIHEEEIRRYRASHLFDDINSDRTSLILRYYIKPRDFVHGGAASSNIKRALLRLGANQQLARRCGIAIYEAEMNLIIHTNNGGYVRIEIEPHQITMRTIDDGPGIPDVDLAMKAGYSTATEQVREMGFGAGMGLVNISRCVDKMTLESNPSTGTRLEMKIYIRRETGPDAANKLDSAPATKTNEPTP